MLLNQNELMWFHSPSCFAEESCSMALINKDEGIVFVSQPENLTGIQKNKFLCEYTEADISTFKNKKY